MYEGLTDPHEIEIRVRYIETDAMGFLHHARYFGYFEMGRVELFRAQGGDYRGMEERGYLFVIVRAECDFRKPARFDDQLTLRTQVTRLTPARLEHEYRLTRAADVIANAKSTLACVNRNGEIQRISEEIMFGGAGAAQGNSQET